MSLCKQMYQYSMCKNVFFKCNFKGEVLILFVKIPVGFHPQFTPLLSITYLNQLTPEAQTGTDLK